MSVAVDVAVALSLRVLLALLLGVAAMHKLRDPERFRATLAAYELLPVSLTAVAAWAVVAVEILLASALMAPGTAAAGGAGAALLLLAYAAAIGVNVVRGRRDIDCGCAGPSARVPLSGALVVRNVFLAAAAAMLLLPVSVRPLAWIDALTVSGATAAIAACWLASERMLALAPALARLRAS